MVAEELSPVVVPSIAIDTHLPPLIFAITCSLAPLGSAKYEWFSFQILAKPCVIPFANHPQQLSSPHWFQISLPLLVIETLAGVVVVHRVALVAEGLLSDCIKRRQEDD